MNKNLKDLIKVLNELMSGVTNPLCSQSIDMDELYNISLQHGFGNILTPIMHKYIKDNKDIQNQQLQKFNNIIQKTILSNVLLTQDIIYLVNTFEKHNLSYVIIKGPAVSKYYKYPEYRSMSDLDIFIKEEEWQTAEEILKLNGYIQAEDEEYSPLHVLFTKKGRVSVELHKNLIHTGYLGQRNTKHWYEHIWKHKRRLDYNGIKFYAMSAEDELINSITHFASHFFYIGTSPKHIFEIALIIRNEKIDWTYVENIFDEIGFIDFACLLLSICKTFFNANVPEHLCNISNKAQYRFMNDVFRYFSLANKIENFNGWRNIINNYRYVIKKPLLDPIILAIEFSSQLNINGLKIKAIINTFRNVKMINKKLRIVRNYGFINS